MARSESLAKSRAAIAASRRPRRARCPRSAPPAVDRRGRQIGQRAHVEREFQAVERPFSGWAERNHTLQEVHTRSARRTTPRGTRPCGAQENLPFLPADLARWRARMLRRPDPAGRGERAICSANAHSSSSPGAASAPRKCPGQRSSGRRSGLQQLHQPAATRRKRVPARHWTRPTTLRSHPRALRGLRSLRPLAPDERCSRASFGYR